MVQGDVAELVKPLRGIFAWMMPFASLPIIWWWLVYDHDAGRRYWPQLAVLLFGWAVYMIGMYSPKKEQPVPPREQEQADLEERVLPKVTALRSDYDEAMLVLERAIHVPEPDLGHPAWSALYEVQCAARPLLARYRASERGQFPDPGKQALAILQRGEDCDWYSIRHSNEMHEAFDCLEIYWRTKVEKKNEDGCSRGFEDRAGFRVRWHVASSNTSYCEAYGVDLMSTILEARELADRGRLRVLIVERMDQKHPALEAWKNRAPKRKYGFHGLNLEKWSVRLDYPGGLAWSDHAELEQAIKDALAKAPA